LKKVINLIDQFTKFFNASPLFVIDLVIPFPKNMRQEIDKMIVKINEKVLKAKGYAPMPLRTYKYFQSVSRFEAKDFFLI